MLRSLRSFHKSNMEISVDVKSHCRPALPHNVSEIPSQKEHTFVFQGQLHRWNCTENWKEGSDLEEGRTERSVYVSIENIQDNEELSKLLHRGNTLTHLSLLLKKKNQTKTKRQNKTLCYSEVVCIFIKITENTSPSIFPLMIWKTHLRCTIAIQINIIHCLK